MKHLLRAMGAAMLAALLLSACSTPQEQTEPSAPQTTQATQAATGATEESATEAEELLALPRDLGSGLTLQAVLPFSGPNVDADGAESDQLATIIVQNDGGMAVGAADITLTCEDGAELRFRVTDLPVGGSCYAFELNSAQYTGENRVCAASAEVEPDGSLSVDYRVSVMELTGTYASVQVGMRSLTGAAVTYQINSGEEQTMNSTVDMYYKVKLVEGKLVIQNQNVSGGILALTRLKVTSAAAASTDDPGVVPQTTPEAIRYAMALMRGLEVPQFTDVPEGAWYHDYVYDLVYRGVVNGMTATTYEPEGKLTRAQFVKLLACSLADAETLKTYEGKHPFKDSEGHWAEAYIAWAKDKGIVEGVSATEFDPEAPITREQMATIFGRYALKQGIELPKDAAPAQSFPDADKISEYAREFVELMRIAGILNGYEDGTFRPQGNATRAEAAKLFSLFLSITDKLAK